MSERVDCFSSVYLMSMKFPLLSFVFMTAWQWLADSIKQLLQQEQHQLNQKTFLLKIKTCYGARG